MTSQNKTNSHLQKITAPASALTGRMLILALTFSLITTLIAALVAGLYHQLGAAQHLKPIPFAGSVSLVSGSSVSAPPLPIHGRDASSFAASEQKEETKTRLVSIQSQVKADKQNAALWFTLGNEYMRLSEFKNAIQVYHYAQRLSLQPDAGLYGAKATAQYYANKQYIDDCTQTWIDKALQLDPNNASALMILATDHFLHGRHQKAVKHWVKILDANDPATDRISLIQAIHQAKAMNAL